MHAPKLHDWLYFTHMQLSRRQFYEKPTEKRERLEYEKCNRLYNRQMKAKIHFVMKQHDPLPPL